MMDKKKNLTFIFSAGGTGGHIYPAIAIADALKKCFPEAQFVFVGALGRMEMEKVPQLGYDIIGIDIQGINRSSLWKNIAFPFKLIKSLVQAYGIIKKYNPLAVIGTGGFASASILKMAQLCGVPYFVQEQNSYAGLVNKWVGKGAKRIFTAYPAMERFFPKNKILLTGNPIRENILISKPCEQDYSFFGFSPKKPILFIMGGSLGAKRINEFVASRLSFFESLNIQVLWQCGKMYYEKYASLENKGVRIFPFIEKMNKAYAVANVIISRSGASSVSELCAVGKPVIFIPSPNVAEDHQTKNAQAIVKEKAALMLKESDLDLHFNELFSHLMQSPHKREILGENIKKLARLNATSQIVETIVADLNIPHL